MSVEILAKLEADLRQHTGKPDLVLSDFFDFVCGTSTGAIIATCLAAGMSTGQIREFYVKSGATMFEPSSFTKRLRYSYNDGPLAQILQTEINRALGYKDGAPLATLGNENLQCLLMMVMRNHTTDLAMACQQQPGRALQRPQPG